MVTMKGNLEGSQEKLRLYLAITILLAVFAVALYLITPNTRTKSGCLSFLTPTARYSCLGHLALSTRNATLCSIMPVAYADSCYKAVGTETLNYSICAGIHDPGYAASCAESIANTTGSAKPCSVLNGTYRNGCVATSAVKLLNESYCAYASNASAAELCSSAVGVALSEKSGNASYCASVNNSIDPAVTGSILQYSGASGYTLGNISTALGTPLSYLEYGSGFNLSARDICYLKLASKLHNGRYCSYIYNASAAGICNSTFASAASVANTSAANYTQMLNGCSQKSVYMNSNYSTLCTESVLLYKAIETRNASVCKELGINLSSTCYTNLAQTYNDSQYCSYITNASENSACVFGVHNNLSAITPYS